MPIDSYNFANDKNDSRVLAITDNGAVLQSVTTAGRNPRILLGALAGFTYMQGFAPRARTPDTGIVSSATEFIVQTIVGTNNAVERYRVVVRQASTAVEIVDLSDESVLQTVAQNYYCDIIVDSAGLRTSITAPALFDELQPPAASQSLLDTVEDSRQLIEQGPPPNS